MHAFGFKTHGLSSSQAAVLRLQLPCCSAHLVRSGQAVQPRLGGLHLAGHRRAQLRLVGLGPRVRASGERGDVGLQPQTPAAWGRG